MAGTPTTKKATIANLTKGLDTFVASGASNAKGLVPAPGAVAGTTKFLREDATFQVPATSLDINGLTAADPALGDEVPI
ncbi:MAG: hypothetical protein AAB368_03270, partial [bacterium]